MKKFLSLERLPLTIMIVAHLYLSHSAYAMSQIFSAERFEKSTELSLPMKRDGVFNVSTTDGTVTVTAHSKNEVEVLARIVGRANNSEMAEKIVMETRVQLVPEKEGITLEINRPILKKRQGLKVHITAKIPMAAQLIATTRDGDVKTTGVAGNLTITTRDGTIDLEDGNSLKLMTRDGDITAQKFSEDITVRSTDGNIRVSRKISDHPYKAEIRTRDGKIVGENLNGKINMASVDGNISLKNARGMMVLDSRDGNITSKMITGDMTVTTRDGRINIGCEGHSLDPYVFKIVSRDGNVVAENCNGKGEFQSRDGRITTHHLTGSFKFLSKDGPVTATDIMGDVTAKSVDGKITLSGRGELSEDFKYHITTRDGKVAADNLKGTIEMTSRDGSIEATSLWGNILVVTRNGKLQTKSISGDLTVKRE